MSRFAGLIGCMAVASVALWPPSSPAQEAYPSRTVKIVVPAVAGSTTDTLARVVADQLSQKWGKATIVENIPGGAMNIAARPGHDRNAIAARTVGYVDAVGRTDAAHDVALGMSQRYRSQ